jgi:hypothetical protein
MAKVSGGLTLGNPTKKRRQPQKYDLSMGLQNPVHVGRHGVKVFKGNDSQIVRQPGPPDAFSAMSSKMGGGPAGYASSNTFALQGAGNQA